MKVAVTGAGGVIGKAVMAHLADRYELTAITRSPVDDFPSIVADAADLATMTEALQGVHAVVHLAASPSVTTPWEDVLHNNIEATYAVYEAARLNGVEAIVSLPRITRSAGTNSTDCPKSMISTILVVTITMLPCVPTLCMEYPRSSGRRWDGIITRHSGYGCTTCGSDRCAATMTRAIHRWRKGHSGSI
ncbi:MAG: NAD(P)-dependent oxidoreductase [Thermomicrobiales bacterium]